MNSFQDFDRRFQKRQNDFDRDFNRMRIFFKIWFCFVLVVTLSIFGTVIYTLIHAAQLGPEGVGKMIGAALKGAREAAQ